MNWTATKTSRLEAVPRVGISSKEILLNQKLRNLQTLTLNELDRSVMDDVSVLAQLSQLESLNLSKTNVENRLCAEAAVIFDTTLYVAPEETHAHLFVKIGEAYVPNLPDSCCQCVATTSTPEFCAVWRSAVAID
jgi:hypothetical protein